jgi:hypothetical protein
MIRFKILVGIPSKRACETLLRSCWGDTDCRGDRAERMPAQAQSDDLLFTLGRGGLACGVERSPPCRFRFGSPPEMVSCSMVVICSRDRLPRFL